MRRRLRGLSLLVGVMAALAPLVTGARPAAPVAATADAARPAAGQCVEPLSLPIRLSMTAEQVLGALGRPRMDSRAYGGGLTYPGLAVMFDSTGREIWSLTLTGEGRLACGLAVGSPLAAVRAGFPGGAMVYDVYQVKAGPYDLGFRAASGTVTEIRIRPSGRRFVDIGPGAQQAAAGAPALTAADLRALAGRWIDPRSGQSFELFADGRYRTAVGGEGRVSARPDGLVFGGPYRVWNQGQATVTADRQVIEFHWTDAAGGQRYFAFLRAR